jgi:hypothetical protein
MTKHAMFRKKGTTYGIGNNTLGFIFATKRRSGPNLRSSLNDQIRKGGEGEIKGKIDTGEREGKRKENNINNCRTPMKEKREKK